MSPLRAPLVSVVIPCYKQAQFLMESAGSVIAQTWQNWELIIVDDGSPDDTSTIAQQLIHDFPTKKIRLLRKTNGGLADARNAGIEIAQGEWILPLDCDDMITPDFLERCIKLTAEVPSSNLIYSNVLQFGAKEDSWLPVDYTMSKLMIANLFPYASLYKKELWTRSGGYERALPWAGEDYSFWLSCAQIGIRPVRIWDMLFCYRIHPTGSMFTKLMEHWSYVESMIHTCHADIYPSAFLLNAHERIGKMSHDTFEVLQSKIIRFPELSYPHLWMGIKYEQEQKYEAAIDYYRTFSRLHFAANWQGVWRELVCRLRVGDMIGARLNYEQIQTEFPELIWARDLWSTLKGATAGVMH